jgi:hypothetical protein
MIALVGLLVIGAAGMAAAESRAKYTAKVDAAWTSQSHPLEYPSNAHFSGVIGATHNGEYKIFQAGGTATPGLERLSEMGQHKPLDDEIRAAIQEGTAGMLFETGALFRLPQSVSVSFEVDEPHPMVSLVAMIAPSPDWFAGVADVDLRENGQWVAMKTLTLWAWDAGTDNGTTYAAPDEDAQPRGMVGLNESPHFMAAGVRVPVGTVTFTRE